MKRGILVRIGVVLVLSGTSALRAAEGGKTAAQKAASLYRNAMSQYRARRWAQAVPLLEQFLKHYPTNERVGEAYLKLAHCKHALKDPGPYEEALDDVIRRFAGSSEWFYAYASKLARARRQGDREQYLRTLEAMLRSTGVALLRMPRMRSAVEQFGRVGGPGFGPALWADAALGGDHWVDDIVWAADTPERAQRVLRDLDRTFRGARGELPVVWQYGRYLLLRRAGRTTEAEAFLRGAIESLDGDPRAMALWLRRARTAEWEKDAKTADRIWQRLIDEYGNCRSMEGPIHDRLHRLARGGRYDDYAKLGEHFLVAFPTAGRRDRVIDEWAAMARRSGGKAEWAERIGGVVAMLDRFVSSRNGERHRLAMRWKLELLMAAGRTDEALKVAAELVGEEHWSAGSFAIICNYAKQHESFEKLAAAARRKWAIPIEETSGNAPELLRRLRARLADDQSRHAEELGEELFREHPGAAATIRAVKELADYYFQKVLPDPRDKWMDRMISAYPHHPLTESVLGHRITAERAAGQYEKVAKALDLLAERFPGAVDGQWYAGRLRCFDAVKDPKGKAAFVKEHYGPRAAAGEPAALDILSHYDAADGTRSARGEWWMSKARDFQAARLEVYCLEEAFDCFYDRHHRERTDWPGAKKAMKALRQQSVDRQIRHDLEFGDIDLLIWNGEAAAALAEVNERIDFKKSHHDLSRRLDLPALGEELGRGGLLKEGLDLAGKLEGICRSGRDADALELFRARLLQHGGKGQHAAKHYLNIVYDTRWPALRRGYFEQVMRCLRGARSDAFAVEVQRYINRIQTDQTHVPGLLFDLGKHYLDRGNRAVFSVRAQLASRYPASNARDALDREIAKRRHR
jgi:tetratricopeptide (TPR) repeat protein